MSDEAPIDWKADTWAKDINCKLHNENHRFLIVVVDLVLLVDRRMDEWRPTQPSDQVIRREAGQLRDAALAFERDRFSDVLPKHSKCFFLF
jgi:hypothetical protein